MNDRKGIQSEELLLWKDKQDWQALIQTNQKQEKTQYIQIQMKRDIKTDSWEIPGIINAYYENL